MHTVDNPFSVKRYGPPRWRAFALLAAAAVLGLGGFLIPELWAGAAVLLVVAVRDALIRPALALEPDGFHYVAGLHRQFAQWADITAIRVRQERHFLAFGGVLEIDLQDDTLIVLSKMQLNAEPDQVAEDVGAAWRAAVPL